MTSLLMVAGQWVSRRSRRGEAVKGPPRDSGQAMAEYAIVVAALMGGLMTMGFSFLPEFINAFQMYYDSFYILLNLPFP